MKNFLLEIVTPEKKVYSEEADMVIVKGAAGELGILADHIPLVTPLKIAPVTVKRGAIRDLLAVNGGFVEVHKEKVVILAETAELPEDINLERAIAAKERAERRLADSKKEEFDHRRAELALQKAINRIRVAKKQV